MKWNTREKVMVDRVACSWLISHSLVCSGPPWPRVWPMDGSRNV